MVESDMKKNDICGIYIIKNIINGKCYIGKSVTVYCRLRKHKEMLERKAHINIYLQRSWDKYGKGNFTFKLLEPCEELILSQKEHEWVEYHKNILKIELYNINDIDSNGKNRLSEETKRKISEAHKGKKLSEEHINAIKNANIGNKYSLGRKHSQEIKDKMKLSHKNNNVWLGKKHSEETKQKLSLANLGKKNWLGKKHSEETKQKIRLAHLGKKHKKHSEETKQKLRLANLGKKHSEETKRKISESKKKRYAEDYNCPNE
jgi:group I intron endonuclease